MKEIITSAANPRIKAVAALREKKRRDEAGLYLAEGKKSVAEALRFCDVTAIYRAEGCNCPFLSGIPEDKVTVVSQAVFRKMSDETSPEGVLAVVRIPQHKLSVPTKPALFLDGVRDPGNMGAILRTAAACGVEEVFAADSVDAYNPKAVRASMGGIFRVKVHEGSREELLAATKELPFIAADMGGENVFSAQKPAGAFILAVGNEANGLSQEVRRRADRVLSIPMQGEMESLNAAVSLSVMLYTLLFGKANA